MGKITVWDPELQSHVSGASFCQWERLILAVLSISENLRSKNQLWTKIQIWIHNSIQMYQVGTALLDMKFCQSKQLVGIVFNISDIRDSKIKSQGHIIPNREKILFWKS